MSGARVFGRGLAFPVRVGTDGRVAWSEGPQNVRESIQLILLTEPGERIQLAEFGGGLRRFLFQPNTVATRRLIQHEIEQALTRWEPRVALQSVIVVEDPEDGRAAIATITYQLVATQSVEQTTLRVPLAG